jgi:hypothetical protein
MQGAVGSTGSRRRSPFRPGFRSAKRPARTGGRRCGRHHHYHILGQRTTSRRRVYGLDGKVASALEGRAVHLVAASAEAPEPAKKAERGARPKSRGQEKAAAPSTSTFNPFSGQSRY